MIKHYPLTSPTGSFPKHSDLVLVTNEETADLARKAKAKRVELMLDSGLPDEFYPKDVPERKRSEKINVFWAGRLIPRKGLILGIKAIYRCNFPLTLSIAGDGPLRGELQALVEELDLTEKVIWLGRVPWLEMKKMYLKHDVFLFTSIRDSFGGQVLEAMAYGLPVIALNQGGVKTMIPDNAIVKVSYHNPEDTIVEISGQLERLWQNCDLRERIGKAAFHYSLSQRWSTRIERMGDLYSSIEY